MIALIFLMPRLITKTSASCAMNNRKKFSLAKASSRSFDCTTNATPAVTIRPTNIHRKAWVRKAADRRASGLTPSAEGDAASTAARCVA